MRFSSVKINVLSYLCILMLGLVGVLIKVDSGKSAMDRNRDAAGVGANVQEYANYLYLTELFGKPTSLPFYNRFCGDVLNSEQLEELMASIPKIIQGDYWSPVCLPVGVSIEKQRTKEGTFNVRLRHLILPGHSRWVEQFKTAVNSDLIDDLPSIPANRQSELAKYYKMRESMFITFTKRQLAKKMLVDVKRLSKRVVAPQNNRHIGEISFTAQ